jgi:aldose 1-epimerase
LRDGLAFGPRETRIQELRFASDSVELTVLPEVGARWHRLRAFGHDLLRTPDDLEEHVRDTFFWGAYPMAPWCGRIDAGSYLVNERRVSFEPNFPDGTAIHGQVYDVPWDVEGDGAFRVDGGGNSWPWRYEARFNVEVRGSQLVLTYRLTNRSDGPMPGGIGVHPWYLKPLDVAVPATGVLTPNQKIPAVPTPVSGEFDLRRLRPMPPDLDATWTDLTEPEMELRWPALGLRATIRAETSTLYVVAASPEHLPAVAFEQQTHAPQAIRRILNGEPGAPEMLEPGSTLTLRLVLSFEQLGAGGRA